MLVVDDNEINQQIVCGLLSHAGASVDTAPDGGRALAMLEQARFDAVILDIGLPVMDGVSVLENWRRESNLQPVA